MNMSLKKKGDVSLMVTGASGFIARGVLENCVAEGIHCHALSRNVRPAWASTEIDWSVVHSYADPSEIGDLLGGVEYIVHLADRANRREAVNLEEARRNNRAFIQSINDSSVKGVILASSIYARNASAAGAVSYGAMKAAAEKAFLDSSGFKTIVLRLPPVYGPGGKGGLALLAAFVREGVPLPLGSATARRAYLSRRNLATLIAAIIAGGDDGWEKASGKIFEPSDGFEINTRDLINVMGSHLKVSNRMFPCPLSIIRIVGSLINRRDLISGAIDALSVESVDILNELFGWSPVERMPESLAFIATDH